MFKYEVILYWSAYDNSFIAEVPELAGCSTDGKTQRQALDNLEIVISEWIETAKLNGRTVPEPRGRLCLPNKVASPATLCREGVWLVANPAFADTLKGHA